MTPRSFSKRYLSIVRWIFWQLVLVPRSDVFSQSRLSGIVYSVDVTKVAPIVRGGHCSCNNLSFRFRPFQSQVRLPANRFC